MVIKFGTLNARSVTVVSYLYKLNIEAADLLQVIRIRKNTWNRDLHAGRFVQIAIASGSHEYL